MTSQSRVTAAIPSVTTPLHNTIIPRIIPRNFNMQVPTLTEVSISVTSSLDSTGYEPLPSRPVTPVNAVSSVNSNASSAMASDTSYDDGFFLTPRFLTSLMRQSCSRKNFATKLVGELFDENTRKKSNVSGWLGKAKLNAVVMDYST